MRVLFRVGLEQPVKRKGSQKKGVKGFYLTGAKVTKKGIDVLTERVNNRQPVKEKCADENSRCDDEGLRWCCPIYWTPSPE